MLILLTLWAILFIPMGLLLLSCTSVTIPDVPWEASLGTSGAVVFTTLSTNQAMRTYAQFLADWDDLGNVNGPMICTRSAFFAPLKAIQEQQCSKDGNCTNMSPMQSSQFNTFMANLKAAQAQQLRVKK